MADDDTGGTNPLWDPFGFWRDVSRGASPQAFSSVNPFTAVDPLLAQAPLQMLIDAVRSRLLGRSVSWTVGGALLSFHLDDVNMAADPFLLAAGQADDVVVSASDLTWGVHEVASAKVTIHNVHTRSGRKPRLVGAPIDLLLHVSSPYVSARAATRLPRLRVDITETGEVQARLSARPDWGWLTVSLDAEGDRILARPSSLTRGGRSWDLPARIPAFRIRLGLPTDVRLTRLEAVPNGIELHLRVDERHIDYKDAMSFLSRRSSER